MPDEDTGVETPTSGNPEGSNERSVDSMLDEIKSLREENKARRLKEKELEETLSTTKAQFEEATSKVNAFEESLKQYEDYDVLKEQVSNADKKIRTLTIENQLAGKVFDTSKAMKLLEDDYIGEGHKVDVDRFLADNPFLAAKSVTNPASNKGTATKGSATTTDDLSKLSPAELEAFFANHKPAN